MEVNMVCQTLTLVTLLKFSHSRISKNILLYGYSQ